MALTPEQQAEVNRLVNERINEFKAQQEKRNTALKALRSGGKIISGTEDQLFSLLEKEGLLVEENGEFLVKTKDKYGFAITDKISKVLPSLLQDKYPHYASEDIGGNQNTPIKTQSNDVSLNIQELYKAAQKGGDDWNKVLEQAKELYS